MPRAANGNYTLPNAAVNPGDLITSAYINGTFNDLAANLSAYSGNLNFSTLGCRITGDMSNATHNNRLLFQTSTLNNPTVTGVIPNGTGNAAGLNLYAAQDPMNSQYVQFRMDSSTGLATMSTGVNGSGGAQPSIALQTNGLQRYLIDSAGNHTISGTTSWACNTPAAYFKGANGVLLDAGAGTSYPSIYWSNNGNAWWAFSVDSNHVFYLGKYNGSGTWIANSITIAQSNAITLNATSSAAITLSCNNTQIATSSNLCPLFLNANGYVPHFRSNASNTSFEWVNGANTAVCMQLSELGSLYIGLNQNMNKINVQNFGPNYGVGILFKQLVDSGTSLYFLNVAGSAIGSITHSATTTAFNTSSDYRLKDNVKELTGYRERIMAYRPVEFDWKSTGERGQGFVAHDLQAVNALAVTGVKDELDDEGAVKPQGVDHSKLIPDLVAMVQDLQRQIKALKARRP